MRRDLMRRDAVVRDMMERDLNGVSRFVHGKLT